MDQKDQQKRVIIIGSGIIGSTTCFLLSRLQKLRNQDFNITLIDQMEAPGLLCSRSNAGCLIWDFYSIWPGPGSIRKFFTSLFDSQSFFKIEARCLLYKDFWAFIWQFAKNCTSTKHAINIQKMCDLKHFSADVFRECDGIYKFKSVNPMPGALILFTDQAAFDKEKKFCQEKSKEQLVEYSFLNSKQEVIQKEPSLKDMQLQIAGAVFQKDTRGHDSNGLSNELVELSLKSQKVNLRMQTKVVDFEYSVNEKNKKVITAVVTDSGEKIHGDIFILANGLQSRELGWKLGVWLPVWGMKGYNITYQLGKNVIQQKLPQYHVVIEHAIYMSKLPGNRLRATSHAICSDNNEQWPGHFDLLASKISDLFKLQNEDIQQSQQWICTRPVSPDDLPLVGKLKGNYTSFKNLYLNIGHGSRGCILAFGSAQLLTDILDKKRTQKVKKEEFAPNRFTWI